MLSNESSQNIAPVGPSKTLPVCKCVSNNESHKFGTKTVFSPYTLDRRHLVINLYLVIVVTREQRATYDMTNVIFEIMVFNNRNTCSCSFLVV